MHTTKSESIILFIVLCSILILLLVFFIAWIVYRYQQKQNAYFKTIEEIKATHDNMLLQSQVEMQEMTLQHISREIHDNIGQKLALAKLLLNTLPPQATAGISAQVDSSVEILSQAVTELTDLSRSMSNEMVLQNGIIKATETELSQIKKSAVYEINFDVSGNTIFLEVNRELILFRVIQESLHNIIKHAKASIININLHYGERCLALEIADNGTGFNMEDPGSAGTGIKNIQKRIRLLNGTSRINSIINKGTKINIEIPFT